MKHGRWFATKWLDGAGHLDDSVHTGNLLDYTPFLMPLCMWQATNSPITYEVLRTQEKHLQMLETLVMLSNVRPHNHSHRRDCVKKPGKRARPIADED